jgi:hypothetical protein
VTPDRSGAPDVGRFGLSLLETARRFGSLVWFERELFAVTGAAVSAVSDPEVKLWLDEASHRHAWRAQQLAQRLPAVGDIDPASYVAPGSPSLVSLMGELRGDGSEFSILVGLYGVVMPDLAAAYRYFGGLVDARTDPTSVRVLEVVGRDAVEDWVHGRIRAGRAAAAQPHRAAELMAHVTSRLADAGGCVGACTFVVAG